MGFFDSLTNLADSAKGAISTVSDTFDTSTYDTNKAATIASHANMDGRVIVDVDTIDPSMLENNQTMHRTGSVGQDIERMKQHNAGLIKKYEDAVQKVDQAGRLVIESKQGQLKAEKQAIKDNIEIAKGLVRADDKLKDQQGILGSNSKKMNDAKTQRETLFGKIVKSASEAKAAKAEETISKGV